MSTGGARVDVHAAAQERLELGPLAAVRDERRDLDAVVAATRAPAARAHAAPSASTAARAVSGESVALPGAFLTGANSSARRTSSTHCVSASLPARRRGRARARAASEGVGRAHSAKEKRARAPRRASRDLALARALTWNASKMKASSLSPLFAAGAGPRAPVAASATGIFFLARWYGSVAGLARAAFSMNARWRDARGRSEGGGGAGVRVVGRARRRSARARGNVREGRGEGRGKGRVRAGRT